MSVPPEIAPPEILNAAIEFVRVVNKHGAKCVGAVIVVVFDSDTRVIPVLDSSMQPVGGSSPTFALLEDALVGLSNHADALLRIEERKQESN